MLYIFLNMAGIVAGGFFSRYCKKFMSKEPDFRSKMKKMVLNHLIKHHFYLLWR